MTDGFEGYVTASVMSPGNDDASEQAPVQGTSRVMQVRDESFFHLIDVVAEKSSRQFD